MLRTGHALVQTDAGLLSRHVPRRWLGPSDAARLARAAVLGIAKPPILAGLILRLAMLAVLEPLVRATWFGPFIAAAGTPSAWLDPWSAALTAGLDARAFPYGPAMHLLLLPAALTSQVFPHAAVVLVGLTVLAAEAAITLLLRRHGAGSRAWTGWWLSPLVLFIGWWHGQLDALPLALLVAGVLLVQDDRIGAGTLLLGIAVAAKTSMALALPVVALWMLCDDRRRPEWRQAALGVMPGIVLTALPLLWSDGFRTMVLGTGETAKLLDAVLPLGNSGELLLAPLAYAVALAFAAQHRRWSPGLLYAMLAASFFSVLVLTPASPGWFLWVMPFLALRASASPLETGLRLAFQTSFLVYFGLFATGSAVPAFGLAEAPTLQPMPDALKSCLLTVLAATGIGLAVLGLRGAHAEDDPFRMRQGPVGIGIAGDSGAGKDTLLAALEGILGCRSVARVAGDDYHRWDRRGARWQTMTHLDPRANDLAAFSRDALALLARRPVLAPHYDHATGRFTAPIEIAERPFVVVQGLHALLPQRLRAAYDIRIFLDMDEELRRALKMRRDVHLRRHSPARVLASMEARAQDAARYVRPQAGKADIIFKLEPNGTEALRTDVSPDTPVSLLLRIILTNTLNAEAIHRALVGICGLAAEVSLREGDAVAEMLVDGDAEGADFAMAAAQLVPDLDRLLGREPVWQPNVAGAMQLIALVELADALRHRGTR
jgi:uridine kinase